MNLELLLVFDDDDILEELKYAFDTEGYNIYVSRSIKEAIEIFKNRKIDFALIDMQYKDGTGLDLKKIMSEVKDIPTIVISTIDNDLKKVLALEYGCDDYIVRPFNILELKARIRAILRRVIQTQKLLEESKNKKQNLVESGFEFNLIARRVNYLGENIDLTGKEFEFFFILALNPDTIFSRKELAEKVWGKEYESNLRTVDVHIASLRSKLKGAGKYISTVRNLGYKFGEI